MVFERTLRIASQMAQDFQTLKAVLELLSIFIKHRNPGPLHQVRIYRLCLLEDQCLKCAKVTKMTKARPGATQLCKLVQYIKHTDLTF
jgi:hypothetical protein